MQLSSLFAMVPRKSARVLLVPVILLVMVINMYGQAGDGVLSGRVLDRSGASVGKVTVVLERQPGGKVLSVVTDQSGAYRFEGLLPGRYLVRATGNGFAASSQTLNIGEGESLSVDMTLDLKAIAEEIVIMASTIAGMPDASERVPGSFQVLDRTSLEKSRVFNFSEALRKVSGVNVRDEEGFGLRPNIGIRGLNPTRSSKVLLLEDGIPLTYAPYGDNASYYHPPVDRFDGIEVLKGSGQILYGPVTVGGVINYITPSPPQKRSGSITLLGGNRNYFNGAISYGGTWGRTGMIFNYLRKQGDGARENTRSGLNDVNFKSVTTLTARQALTLKGNYYGEDSKVTYSGLREDEYVLNPRRNPFRNDFFYGDRWGVAATHAYVFDSNLVLTTNLYGSNFDRRWWRQSSNSNQRPNDSADPNCGRMTNLNTTCGNEGRLREYYSWGLDPRLRANFSLFGVNQETDLGFRYHFENQDRRQENGDFPTARYGRLVENNLRRNRAFSGFIQHRLIFGRLAISPGVRVEKITFERTNRLANNGLGVNGRTELTQVVPGIGISFSPVSSLTIFAGAHRGFAPPRTEDIINNTTGGTIDLDPELSWNYEAGIRSLIGQGVRLEATFFRMDYQNQIIPASLAGGVGSTLTNGGETVHQGAELSARVDTGTILRSRHNFYTSVAYTWLPVADFVGNRLSNVSGFSQVVITGNRLPYAPERLLNLTAGYSHSTGIDALIEAVRVSDQFGDDLNTRTPTPDGQRGLIPANTVWNATVNYHVESLRSTFFVTVKNVLDRTFIVDRARGILPGLPRLMQAGVKVQF